MGQAEVSRVQRKTGKIVKRPPFINGSSNPGTLPSIQPIPHDRMPQMAQVNAQLMRPPSFRAELQQADRSERGEGSIMRS